MCLLNMYLIKSEFTELLIFNQYSWITVSDNMVISCTIFVRAARRRKAPLYFQPVSELTGYGTHCFLIPSCYPVSGKLSFTPFS